MSQTVLPSQAGTFSQPIRLLGFREGKLLLDGQEVELRLRRNGDLRIGCTLVTQDAFEEITRLYKLVESESK